MAAAAVASARPPRSAALRTMEGIRNPLSRSASPALSVSSAGSTSSTRAQRVAAREAGRSATPDRSRSSSTSSKSKKAKPKKRKTPVRTERGYECSHQGCDKAYGKPSRLAEHERTHTGERPYVCSECGQSYLRSTHLTAHMRVHRDPDDKGFACPRDDCDKTFWTATHLQRHLEFHGAQKWIKCPECDMKFVKSRLVREHIAATHRPEGTKPYPCEFDGCGMTFAMRQQLKTHEKIHIRDRYVCTHPSHGDDLPTFARWSLLQQHTRDAHPPVCPHTECGGRVFKNGHNLRQHLLRHEQREHDLDALANGDISEMPTVLLEGIPQGGRRTRRKRRRSERSEQAINYKEVASSEKSDSDSDGNDSDAEDPSWKPKEELEPADDDEVRSVRSAISSEVRTPSSHHKRLPRILEGETGKEWTCGAPGCGKSFKSKFYRDEHAQASHTRHRHKCERCGRSYRRPASLKRHVAEGWCGGNTPTPAPSTPRTPRTPAPVDEGAALTGKASYPGGSEYRRWACPYTDEEGHCGMRFHRVYDVRRHLSAMHDVEVDDMTTREMLLADGQTGDD